METFDRNVAIIGSAVYGGLLMCGMLLFLLGCRGEPFYTHPSPKVAIFSVFWFAFSPSLLFIGGTVPWLCALYGSKAAALTFAIVPGGLFVLIGAYWLTLYDRLDRSFGAVDVPRVAPWRQGNGNRFGGGVYPSAGAPYYQGNFSGPLYPGVFTEAEMSPAEYASMFPASRSVGWTGGMVGSGAAALNSDGALSPPYMQGRWPHAYPPGSALAMLQAPPSPPSPSAVPQMPPSYAVPYLASTRAYNVPAPADHRAPHRGVGAQYGGGQGDISRGWGNSPSPYSATSPSINMPSIPRNHNSGAYYIA